MFFNYGPEANSSYTFPHFYAGNIPASAVRAQMPSIPCEMVRFKSDPDNDGQIYLGGDDVTTGIGWQLDAGDDTGWIPVHNLEEVYYICSDATQRLMYMIVYR